MSVRPALIVLIFLLVCAPIVCCLQNEKPKVAQIKAPVQEPWSTESQTESDGNLEAPSTSKKAPNRLGEPKPNIESDPFSEKEEPVISEPKKIAKAKSLEMQPEKIESQPKSVDNLFGGIKLVPTAQNVKKRERRMTKEQTDKELDPALTKEDPFQEKEEPVIATAIVARKQKTRMLLRQLLRFKDERTFKKHGFAVDGPYNEWIKSVNLLRNSTYTEEGEKISSELQLAPGILLEIGMDYLIRRETKLTRQNLSKLKKTIDYSDAEVALNGAIERGKPPASAKTSKGRQRPKSGNWYVGGTLHQKTALDWQKATYANKLATCGDYVASWWASGMLKPSISRKITSVDELRPYAEELVIFLDEALRRDSDPNLNRKMFANMRLSLVAGTGVVIMKWNK